MVLARAVAARRRLRRARSRSGRGHAVRARRSTWRAGSATSWSRCGCRPCRRRRARAACTSTFRCRPDTSYESGMLFCQIVATVIAARHPKAATVERTVRARPRGTVYVDYLQNILGKTLATAYSARASDFAGVSTPLTLEGGRRGRRSARLHDRHGAGALPRSRRPVGAAANGEAGEPRSGVQKVSGGGRRVGGQTDEAAPVRSTADRAKQEEIDPAPSNSWLPPSGGRSRRRSNPREQ